VRVPHIVYSVPLAYV